MARYSCGFTPAGVGTTVRPCAAILATATVTPILREVSMFNATTTDCTFELVRFSAGTAGADQTEFRYRENAPAAEAVAKGLWTADATIGDRTGVFFELGAAIGDGSIEVLGAEGIEPLVGSTQGLGLLLVEGAPATAPRVKFVWDE